MKHYWAIENKETGQWMKHNDIHGCDQAPMIFEKKKYAIEEVSYRCLERSFRVVKIEIRKVK